MKEIGGYFEFENLVDTPYHEDMVELNIARNALIYLMKAKNIKKVYLPYYLCSSVRGALEYHGFAYEQYYIDATLSPVFDKALSADEYIYIVNYFGQMTDEKLLSFKQLYKNIIVDYAHAFFQRPVKGIDTIYSCRKFFGVSDGAYLSTDVQLGEELEVDVSMNRMRHVLGRYEGKAPVYHADSKKNDLSFKKEPLKAMSRLTRNILGAIPYEDVLETRIRNFEYLDQELKDSSEMQFIKPEGAYGYPMYVKNGIDLRKRMANQKIYLPTIWPELLKDCPQNSIEYDYTANIVLLPCDQRYTLDDMAYMLQCLKRG